MANNVEGLMGVSVEKIREMVDANTVIGKPVEMPGNVTIVPVSRISYGFASGGSDLPSKSSDLFGGGAGAGINITPVAFLTVKDGSVNLLPVVNTPDTIDRALSMLPDLVDKLTKLLSKKKKEDEPAAEDTNEE